MPHTTRTHRVYDGEGDALVVDAQFEDRLVMLPDTPSTEPPSRVRHSRIMWGQHMVEDVLAGRYRSLVCAVNAEDNTRGIIAQLAELLPTSQWNAAAITDRTRGFVHRDGVAVLKFDMDAVEVLALLRPKGQDHLTLADLSEGFTIVAEMIRRRTERLPVASVSFLGARANKLVDDDGHEPSFETVLGTMHDAGFVGDVYPAPGMWRVAPTAVFARYPFPTAIDTMREGGS